MNKYKIKNYSNSRSNGKYSIDLVDSKGKYIHQEAFFFKTYNEAVKFTSNNNLILFTN